MSQHQPWLPLMSSAEDFPARMYRWLDDVLDWLEREAACGGNSIESLANCFPAGFVSKTSPDFCRATADGTLEPSLGRWQNWGMGSPTAFLTLSGSEFHSGAVACSLSDVLEAGDVPPKYFLSAKACRGILRRAEMRGRQLPPALLAALQRGAESTDLDEGEKTT